MVPGVAVGAQRQLVGTAAPRGCADSGSAPPVTELLQGPLLTHLLPPRPGPPGERPLETAQPSGRQPPSTPRVSLSIVSCLKRATPRPHRPGPGEFSCGVSVGHPSVLSPRTLPGPLMVTQPLLLAPPMDRGPGVLSGRDHLCSWSQTEGDSSFTPDPHPKPSWKQLPYFHSTTVSSSLSQLA